MPTQGSVSTSGFINQVEVVVEPRKWNLKKKQLCRVCTSVCAPLMSPETFDLYPASDCVWHPLTPCVPWQARASPSHQNTSFPCQCSLTATWSHFQFRPDQKQRQQQQHVIIIIKSPLKKYFGFFLTLQALFMSVCEPWSSTASVRGASSGNKGYFKQNNINQIITAF